MMKPAILITGASKRLGKALALGMAEDGFTVLLHYFQSSEAAEATAAEVRQRGAECHLFQANLADGIAVHRLIRQVFEAPSGDWECCHLINNASIFEAGGLRQTSEALFDQHLHVNLKAPFFLTQSFATHCRAEGTVLNLLDTRIQTHSTTHFAYSLSKKMLYELTKMAAKELAPHIRVNGICPGLILPPDDQDESYLMEKSKTIPLQKIGAVAEIVQAVRFLRDSPFVTGDCLFLDGGEHLG